MAEKLILFLGTHHYKKEQKKTLQSIFKKNENNPEPKVYTNEESGIIVRGLETSEAPVRYFLKKYNDIDRVVCVVTNESKKDAYANIKNIIKQENKNIKVGYIVYDVSKDNFDSVLGELLLKIDAKKNDKILLETTGGLRNAIINLFMIGKILEYKGCELEEAIYTDFSTSKIKSMTEAYKYFDLINGLQEMVNLGSVKSLREYYGRPASEDKVENLLSSMEKLMENILLCRSENIEVSLKKFNQSLKAADDCHDELMRTLLPAFSERYGEEMDIISLIQWCIDSDLLQQALTLYVEKTPDYIMNKFKVTYPKNTKISAKFYQAQAVTQLFDGICRMGESDLENMDTSKMTTGTDIKKFRDFISIKKEDLISNNYVECFSEEQKVGVKNIRLLLSKLYDENGDLKDNWGETDKDFLPVYEIINRKENMPRKNLGFINSIATLPVEDFEILLEMESRDVIIYTLSNFEKLLNDKEYKVHCSIKDFETIIQDYLYVKNIRNMTNHANVKSTSPVIKYLVGKHIGYESLNNISMDSIKEAIVRGLKNIEDTKVTN